MTKTKCNISEFIYPALNNDSKYTIIRAGRQLGKTYNAFIWIIINLIANPNSKGLWCDTVQVNLNKYVELYIKKILGKERFEKIYYNRQEHYLQFDNGSRLTMISAERPKNAEGFNYHFVVLNEAGLILTNQGVKAGLWDETIKPMCKNATVKIIGTPKGKGTKYEELCKQAKNDEDWAEFHYTCYDSPYWDKKQLDKLKESEPPHIWQQEYLGEFSDVYENSIIKQEWIKYYTILPELKKISIHNDLTHTGKTTSDYYCWCAIGEGIDGNFYVLDWVLEKTDPLNQSHICINKYMQYKHENITKMTYDAVSNDAWGDWTKKEAKNKGISLPLEPLKVKGDKVANLTSVLPHLVSGRVYFNENHSQLQLAMNQLLAFPSKGVHDDFVDCLANCLGNLSEKKSDSSYTPIYF
jgi:predicted phage terminase large subunit-like protein